MKKIGLYQRVLLASALALSARAVDFPISGDTPPRAKVVMVQNDQATIAFEAQPEVVQSMVDHGISKLTDKPTLTAAWLSLVGPKDIIGIKVYSGPGSRSGTRPAVVSAIVEGLLKAGIPPDHIIIWDKRLLDLRLAGFDELARRYHVRIAGAADSGYDEKVFYQNEMMGTLVAGDLDFDKHGLISGQKSYVTRLLTQTVTKIINVAPLLNHNFAGVCGNLYSLAIGSVDNTLRFENSQDRLARAVPEIYAMSQLSDHVVLNVTDALIGQYQGEQESLLHYSTQLNEIWFSKDPVALDVLAVAELDQERQDRRIIPGQNNPDLYRNASLMLELGVSDLNKIRIEKVK